MREGRNTAALTFPVQAGQRVLIFVSTYDLEGELRVTIAEAVGVDCNADGMVNAGDLAALSLEINDGDGNAAIDAGGGTFAGDPVGCDVDGNTIIDVADIACTRDLIFGSLVCTSE